MRTKTNFLKNVFATACLILTISTVNAAAATFTVSNTLDTGAGSLRQAVTDSSAAGSDTIVFDASFNSPRTITLASVITISLATSDSLTITGPGANLLTVSGNNVTGIFDVSTGTVSISGMTLTAGNVGFDGAAISNDGNVTVTNSVFRQNSAGYGGAIGNTGTLTINGCAFTNNSAISGQPGGAIYSNTMGTVTITNSTFTGNTHAAANGGAIGNRGGTMTITGSTFTNNSTFVNGGAIHNGAVMNVNASTFTGNTAPRVDVGNGGAINNQGGGQLTIANSLITGNSASVNGGGIHHQPNATSGAFLSITNSTVSNNIANSDSNANGDGGGLFLTGEGSVSITGSTVNGNKSNTGAAGVTSGDGGGINVSTPTTITNSTVSGNTAERNGGGIYASGTTTIIVTIESSTIAGNTATINGGGVQRASSTNPVNFHNTIVANNIASGGTSPDVLGTVNSNGYNLIENTTGATITGTTTGNITGQDPILDPLGNYGGATQTHRPQLNSPAIDAGDPASFQPTDQRGVARPIDGNLSGSAQPDIGAVEATAPTAANVCVSGKVLTVNGRGLANAVVWLTDADGGVRATRTTASGHYRFDDVAAGESYILSVRSKRYVYAPQVAVITEDVSDLNFIAAANGFEPGRGK